MEGKLLITGITGYIGFQTLTTALKRGYKVRGVIRHEGNKGSLQKQSALVAQCHEQGQLEFAVIPNFMANGAFDEALSDVTAIIHLASPLFVETEDYESDIIAPAVGMVKAVLESAARHPSIRRVVVTSSWVTLIPLEWNWNPDSSRLYTASDINDNPNKPFYSSMEAYWASQALARMAVRDFVLDQEPSFDYTPIPPSLFSRGQGADVLVPALTSPPNSPLLYVGVPVHVADVARAHVDAVNGSLIPGNSEYILSSDTPEGIEWDDEIHGICKKYFAQEVDSGDLPLQGSLTTIKWRLDGMSTEKAFGWKFTSFEETMKGLISQYLQLKKNEKK